MDGRYIGVGMYGRTLVQAGRIVSEYVFTVSHWSTNKVQLMLSAKILGPLRPALRCLAARQVYLLAAVSLYLNLKTISLHRTKQSSALSILSDCAAAHWRLCKLNKQRKKQIILITGYQNLARNCIFDPKSGVNGPKGSSWNSFPINNVDIKWPSRIAIAAAGHKAA